MYNSAMVGFIGVQNPIIDALLELIEGQHLLAEGSAATAYASARSYAAETRGTTAAILCGSNIGVDKPRGVLA